MEITDVRIRKVLQDDDQRLLAVVSITIDNALAVHDIKLIKGNDRIFVSMPSREDEKGMHRNSVHPINPEARELIESKIINAYNDVINNINNTNK